MTQPEATFLFLKVSGDQAVKSASDVLARLVSGIVPAGPAVPAMPEALAAAEALPALPAPEAESTVELAAKRITRRRKVKYQKADDEPDGFSAPQPAPSKAIATERGGRASSKFNEFPAKAAKPPGALATKILKVLDGGTGVAPLEELVREIGANAHGINMAITKCSQLKRLPDGRIALQGYRDED